VQRLGLRLAERRGRLVEHQHFHLPGEQPARQIDELSFSEPEGFDRHVERKVGPDRLERLLCEGDPLCGARLLAGEEEIVEHAHVRGESGLLVDDGDAELRGITRGELAFDAGAVDREAPLGGSDHSGGHVEERALPGAVVAEQADDLAGLYLEADIVERPCGTEVDGDSGEGEARLRIPHGVDP